MTNVVTPGAWLGPHVARKHRLVQAPGPGLPVVFLTFLVLAQWGGGYLRPLCPLPSTVSCAFCPTLVPISVASDRLGLYTDWNCCISLKSRHVELEDASLKARLPHGIGAIKKHLKSVDNVPLLVSLFCDAAPLSTSRMVSVLQSYNEVASHSLLLTTYAWPSCSICTIFCAHSFLMRSLSSVCVG